jgi:protein-S-isoprenylcysteine O-methyltransferase Ste14
VSVIRLNRPLQARSPLLWVWMLTELLRIAAFCMYLAAWVVSAVAAVASAIPRRNRQAIASVHITVPIIVGTLLQGLGALATTLSMGDGPLRPRTFELLGTLALAPLGAFLFVWALRTAPNQGEAETLVTGGAYAWLRHPMYLAFLAMLVATGLIVSAGPKLIPAVVLYLAGSEFRIASEEANLAEKFPAEYSKYRLRTRWRYLPGLR